MDNVRRGKHYTLEYDTNSDNRFQMSIGVVTSDEGTGIAIAGGLYPYKLPPINSKARFIYVIGGTGGGKTIIDPVWAWNELLPYPGEDGLAVGPDWPRMNLQLVPYFREFFDMSPLAGHYDEVKHVYRLGKNWGNIYFLAADTDADARKLESLHARWGIGDEAGQWVNSVWNSFRKRINEKKGRALISSTAYLTRGTWLRDVYEAATVHRWESDRQEYKLLQTGRLQESGNPFHEMFLFKSEDNPQYDREVLAEERRLLSPKTYKVYYEGDIPEVMGLIFPEFGSSNIVKSDREREVLDRINSPQAVNWIRQIGHDLGWGHPSVSIFGAYDPERDKLVITDEIYLEKDDTSLHVQSLIEVNARHVHKFKNVQYPLEGAEQAGLAQEYAKTKGWDLYFQRAQDDKETEKLFRNVEAGIAIMGGLIAHGRFEVIESRCPRLIEELRKYRRESFETQYLEGAKIVKKENDGVDATRYLILPIRNRMKFERKKWEKESAKVATPIHRYSPTEPPERPKRKGTIRVGHGVRIRVR